MTRKIDPKNETVLEGLFSSVGIVFWPIKSPVYYDSMCRIAQVTHWTYEVHLYVIGIVLYKVCLIPVRIVEREIRNCRIDYLNIPLKPS